MEYHFTGTGASPDFTFIADAIVDSVGNRIFYSSIKKTKIKVKSSHRIFYLISVLCYQRKVVAATALLIIQIT